MSWSQALSAPTETWAQCCLNRRSCDAGLLSIVEVQFVPSSGHRCFSQKLGFAKEIATSHASKSSLLVEVSTYQIARSRFWTTQEAFLSVSPGLKVTASRSGLGATVTELQLAGVEQTLEKSFQYTPSGDWAHMLFWAACRAEPWTSFGILVDFISQMSSVHEFRFANIADASL